MKNIMKRRLLIGISVLFLVLFLILPLAVVITQSLKNGWDAYVQTVTDEYTVKAILLTIEATVIAVIVNTIFGIFAAWLITKF